MSLTKSEREAVVACRFFSGSLHGVKDPETGECRL